MLHCCDELGGMLQTKHFNKWYDYFPRFLVGLYHVVFSASIYSADMVQWKFSNENMFVKVKNKYFMALYDGLFERLFVTYLEWMNAIQQKH